MKRHYSLRTFTIALSLALLAGVAVPSGAIAASWNPINWLESSSGAQQKDDSALQAKQRADEALQEAERAEAAAREARLRAEKAKEAAEAALSKNAPGNEDPYYAQRAGKPRVQFPATGDETSSENATSPDSTASASNDSSTTESHQGGGWNPLTLFKPGGDDYAREQRDAHAAEKSRREAEKSVQEEVRRRQEAQAEALRQVEREQERQTNGGKSVWNMLNVFQKPDEQASTEQTTPPEKRDVSTDLDQSLQTKVALIQTEKGDIAIELYPDQAPLTVANFIKLVNDGFYNKYNMKFHRVIPGFVIQTGDPTGTGAGGSKDRIPLEAKNKLTHNTKGVVAMARGADPDSATSQFYITLAPQNSLDGKYAIFGKVISGMDVLDKIEKGDMLYGVSLVDRTAVKPDPQPEKKTMFSRLF